ERYIVDFGQNMVGYVIMTLEGRAGQPVVFKYAEKLTDRGDSLNMASLRRTLATDQYTPAADGTFTWIPTFPMHGFRYMEVEGVTAIPNAGQLTGQVIWDKMDRKGSFECSDERLNRLYRNICCGLRSNYRGMPIDCPQRDERQGWIGDRGGTIWGEPYLFNVAPLYRKWMDDVYDSMKNGQRISVVSPRYWSIYTDDMSHSSVFLYMAEMLYSRYGDDSGIRTYYPAMKSWFEYATAKNLKEDGIFRMKKDEYKDWIVPPESPELIHATDPSRITNSPVLQTGILVGTLDLMMKFARLTGNDADVPFYEGMKTRVVEAYNREFFDPERNCYDNNTLTANLIPVYFDIVPAAHKQAVVENIVNRIENDFDGHLCVGNVGMRYVMEVLTRNGHADLAYKLCTIDTYPSWGYMIKKGATTVWELWNGDEAGPSMNSGCHAHLIGDLLRWYYEDLAGIAPEPTASGIIAAAPAFRRIWMQPCFPEGLDHVKATFDSPQGTISSEWTVIGHKLVWRIEIPVGSTATVVAPARFNLNPGKLASYTEGGNTRIFLPSGKYILQSK
ncbi:MAG: family 78 glycoside hydrolase catalytic domain, partial [Clostridia bacterium]|nr:family 78 glycoside hydrolase catalytic domain [Clostridia bacterium]